MISSPFWTRPDVSRAGHLPPRLWSVCPAPPSIGLTAARSIFRWRGVKGRFACPLTRHFDLFSSSCGPVGPWCCTGGVHQSGGALCSFRGHRGPAASGRPQRRR